MDSFKVKWVLCTVKSSCLIFLFARFSGLHQSLPPGEWDLCCQEEDQVSEEVFGSSLQPGPGLLGEPAGESGAGENVFPS